MQKHTKIILLLFVAHALFIAPLFAQAASESDYSSIPEKIYERIDTISFTFDGTYLKYGVTMASKFEERNNTHARLRFDVFIKTDDENYVTNLAVNLTYDVTFTVNSQVYEKTGEVSDSSGMFQYGDLLYAYDVCYVDVPSASLFPARVAITFDYIFEADGGKFTKTGTATASNTFLGPTMMAIFTIAIIGGIVLTIILIVRSAKRRQAARYKARAAARSGVPVGLQAPGATPQVLPPTYGTPVQSGIPSSGIVMSNLQGSVPPVAQAPIICPKCGGNVVNLKCQSCGGVFCVSCGHSNAPGGHFCEKCGKNL